MKEKLGSSFTNTANEEQFQWHRPSIVHTVIYVLMPEEIASERAQREKNSNDPPDRVHLNER